MDQSKYDTDFLVKLSTALTHLVGIPNFDAMYGKYYARFEVKNTDNSDSYLRKAAKKYIGLINTRAIKISWGTRLENKYPATVQTTELAHKNPPNPTK